MTTVTLADRVFVPDGVLAREIDGETVLLNLQSGIYFGLDAVATDMWRALRTGVSLGEAAEALEATYDIDPAVLRADLLRLTDQLAAKGLVRVAAPPASSRP